MTTDDFAKSIADLGMDMYHKGVHDGLQSAATALAACGETAAAELVLGTIDAAAKKGASSAASSSVGESEGSS